MHGRVVGGGAECDKGVERFVCGSYDVNVDVNVTEACNSDFDFDTNDDDDINDIIDINDINDIIDIIGRRYQCHSTDDQLGNRGVELHNVGRTSRGGQHHWGQHQHGHA